jgi:serine/threonine-protein kinase
LVWLLNTKHVADPNIELGRFFDGQPLWAAGLLALLYLAVEPYVRRFWPRTVVSWSRLMARQWRDPLVGRDILFGAALGLLIHMLGIGSDGIDARLGYVIPPHLPALDNLLGTQYVLALMGNQVFNAILNAMVCVFGMVILKILLRSEWAAVGVAIGLFTFTSSRGIGDGGSYAVNLVTVMLFIAIIVLTIQRLGLLATIVLFLVNSFIDKTAATLDTSRWFFAETLLPVLVIAALAVWSFYVSRGGEPLLGRQLLD